MSKDRLLMLKGQTLAALHADIPLAPKLDLLDKLLK